MTWRGGAVAEQVTCVLAPNPGPMTLDGTNTWVVHAPGSAQAVVIDPGPDDERHLQAVAEVVRERGATVAVVLLTHGHADHSAGARRFAKLVGCGVRAADAAHGDEVLAEGDQVTVDGLELHVLATPGHTADSLTFRLAGPELLLTGDTVLGRGTSVVAHPDGALGPYLASLRRLRNLVHSNGVRALLPGHGPVCPEPAATLTGYLDHRERRLAQVRAAVEAGARTPEEVVTRVYADVDRSLWPAALRSVRAQLDHLGGDAGAGLGASVR